MTYYAFFNKANAEINFTYDTYLSSNLVIGANSNARLDRMLIYNNKDPANKLQANLCLEEMNPEDKTVRITLLSSNLSQLEMGIYSFSNNSNAYLKNSGAFPFTIEAGGAERMRFSKEGFIGIGTTLVSENLHIGVPSLFSGSNIKPSLLVNNRGSGPALRIAATANNNLSMWQVQNNSGVTWLDYLNNGNLYLYPFTTGNCFSIGTTRNFTSGTVLDVNGNCILGGNVGIGTTITTQRLNVQGDVYTSGSVYQNVVNRAVFSQISTSTSGGGNSTANLYVTRIFNTVEYNDIAGVSLNISNGQFTLPAGKYHIRIQAAAYNCGYNRVRLFNITSTVPVAYGMAHFCASNVQNEAILDTIYSPNATFTYIVQHWTESTVTGNGFGVYNALHAAGYLSSNTYMTMHLNKLT